MPVVKVSDMAFVRFHAPDLDRAERFLLDFGIIRVERTSTSLYMRGTDEDPFIHVTHVGEPKLVSSAWYVDDVDDLDRLSRIAGATGIESLDEPGGGRRVRLTDPLGYEVEFIHGRRPAAPLRACSIRAAP